MLKEKRIKYTVVITSGIFGVSQVIGHCIDITEKRYIHAPLVVNLIFFLALFFFSAVILLFLVIHYNQKKEIKSYNRKIQPKEIFIIIIFFWMIWYLVYMPGFVVPDSFNSVRQGLGDQKWSNHFPVVYTFFVGCCMRVGKMIFQNYNAGIVIYSIIQMVSLACIMTHIICKLIKAGMNYFMAVFSIAYYALSPAFASYSMIMWRDPWFASLLVLFSLKLIDFLHGVDMKKGGKIKCGLLLMGSCLLRNNGIYIVWILLMVLSFHKKLRRLAPCCIFVLVAMQLFNFSLNRAGLNEDSFVESIGIPYQQMASVIVNGGTIPEADKEFLYTLLPEEKYKEKFDPFVVDSLKWDGEFNKKYLNANKILFIKTWFHLLKGNMKIYIKQYFMSTVGFWYMGEGLSYEEFGLRIFKNQYDIHFYRPLETFLNVDLVKASNEKCMFIPVGILVWMGFFHGAVCIALRRGEFLLPLTVMYATWLTMMIGTPIAYGLRYLWVYALYVPIFFRYHSLSSGRGMCD